MQIASFQGSAHLSEPCPIPVLTVFVEHSHQHYCLNLSPGVQILGRPKYAIGTVYKVLHCLSRAYASASINMLPSYNRCGMRTSGSRHLVHGAWRQSSVCWKTPRWSGSRAAWTIPLRPMRRAEKSSSSWRRAAC